MSRNVGVVVLCEDTQHEAFVRRFLGRRGWNMRRVRIIKSPSGGGAADQFVRHHFPAELRAYRSKASHLDQALVVMLDGDNQGLEARRHWLDEACGSSDVARRTASDRVAIFVPTWCIETWFSYLDGEDVVEDRPDYPKLNRPRDCQRHVDALIAMRDGEKLRQPSPPSLVAACDEYSERMVTGVR